MTGAPCLHRALAETQDILDAIRLGKVPRMLGADGTPRAIGAGITAESGGAFAFAYGWLKSSVEQHIEGRCCCDWPNFDPTPRTRLVAAAEAGAMP